MLEGDEDMRTKMPTHKHHEDPCELLPPANQSMAKKPLSSSLKSSSPSEDYETRRRD